VFDIRFPKNNAAQVTVVLRAARAPAAARISIRSFLPKSCQKNVKKKAGLAQARAAPIAMTGNEARSAREHKSRHQVIF